MFPRILSHLLFACKQWPCLYLISFCILQDPRFNRDIDVKTGYTTHSLVSMPVCNFDGEVIGVAQIMNKTNGNHGYEFSETDLKVFQRYLTFCGIGIQNAQLFEVSILEYKKNKVRNTLFYVTLRFFANMYFRSVKLFSSHFLQTAEKQCLLLCNCFHIY